MAAALLTGPLENVHKEDGGFTPLSIAAAQGHANVVRTLIAAGASSSKTSYGNTPLEWAEGEGHEHVVQHLRDGAGRQEDSSAGNGENRADDDIGSFHTSDSCGEDVIPLCIAAERGTEEEVCRLLETSSAHVNERGQDGATPLFIAAQEGRADIVLHLINAGAEIDSRSERSPPGGSALFIASRNGHVDVVHLLLTAHADVEAVDFVSGNTPLIEAASGGFVAIMRALLEAGAGVDVANRNGCIPLYCAVISKEIKAVRFLVAAGADFYLGKLATPSEKITALDAAKGEIAKYLTAVIADRNEQRRTAITERRRKCLESLVVAEIDAGTHPLAALDPNGAVQEKTRLVQKAVANLVTEGGSVQPAPVTSQDKALRLAIKEALKAEKKAPHGTSSRLLMWLQRSGCRGGFVETWDEGKTFHCSRCKKNFADSRRASEYAAMKAVQEVDRMNAPDQEKLEAQHVARGVKVGWLRDFASSECEGLATWEVVEQIVKPRTAVSRCRYTELPEMTDNVGRASVFVSHVWKSRFLDTVAAITHVIDDDAFVWVDIFAGGSLETILMSIH
eukprot:gene1302-1889_t